MYKNVYYNVCRATIVAAATMWNPEASSSALTSHWKMALERSPRKFPAEVFIFYNPDGKKQDMLTGEWETDHELLY